MELPQNTPHNPTHASISREQISQVISESLVNVDSQHILEAVDVFHCERPNLGASVPISLYRAIRLLGLREILGAELSAVILEASGRLVAQKMGVRNINELVLALQELSVGRAEVIENTDGRLVLEIAECATCSGLPNIGEAVCYFETGFMARALESMFRLSMRVVETNCWGLGNRLCRWEAEKNPLDGEAKSGSFDQLRFIIAQASKASVPTSAAAAFRYEGESRREFLHPEMERLKKDLTEMVVHDMRSPLMVVLESIRELGEAIDWELFPHARRWLSLAEFNGERLKNMAEDLLDVSRLEDGKLVYNKAVSEVSELIAHAKTQVETHASWKGITLNIRVGADVQRVKCDKDLIIRVLVNLLDNAVRHTGKGGEITVGASLEGEWVRFSVADNGEGIPPEYLEKVFEKFVQVECHRSRRKLSTGLGLTFCKLVTEGHGGRIWVESKSGVGSTFHFTLPVA